MNMPLLYGEGKKAFMRLQHEIIRTSDDQTIFAWKDKKAGYRNSGGLLAASPDYFSHARGLFALPNLQRPISVPSEITNKGLRVEMILIGSEAGSVIVRAPVAIDKSRLLGNCYSIILRRVTAHGDQYSRVQVDTLDESIGIGSNTGQFIINGKSVLASDGKPVYCTLSNTFLIIIQNSPFYVLQSVHLRRAGSICNNLVPILYNSFVS